MSLIFLNSVSLRYGEKVLLDKADMNVERGDSIALVGRNGCGKTSLLKIIAGISEPDEGSVERMRGVKIAYMPQEVPEGLSGSVYSVVGKGMGKSGQIAAEYREALSCAERGNSDGKSLEILSHEMENLNAWGVSAKISEIVARLELEPDIEVSEISAGLKRRVLLGRELASNPDVLMLDEPTNHMDIDSVVWLERFLKSCGKTLIFVSHDRSFLRNLATRVVEVDRGSLISFDCGFDAFEKRRDELLEAQARNDAAFDKKLMKEEAWLRRGVKARRTRNEGRVRELLRLRKIRAARRDRPGTAEFSISDSSAAGEKVMDVKNISVELGGRRIIDGFSTTIYRGDKIGIIGRNGIGKTTLLNALLGRVKLSGGSVGLGTRLQVAYFDQLRERLDPKIRPFDFIGEGSDYVSVVGDRRSVVGYLQDFLFEPAQIMGEIGMLSGGERNRLMLAKLFTSPANLLVLDEPTNDLDMQTIEMLEAALVSFKGTVLLVSHDRTFLNNIVSGVFCFEGGGKIAELVGGYDEWERYRAAKSAAPVPAQSVKVGNAGAPRRSGKLSNKEREELARIPVVIEEHERERAELEEKLVDTDFVTRNYGELEKINARLEEMAAEDEAMFARWQELEERS